MGWVEELSGSVVGMDAAPLIYFIEENPVYLGLVDPFFEAVDQGKVQIVTSSVTLTETLVHPFGNGSTALIAAYSEISLHSHSLITITVSAEIAIEAARIRATHSIRTPDAIQLATATLSGATSFLTNDRGLPSIPGLRVISLDGLR